MLHKLSAANFLLTAVNDGEEWTSLNGTKTQRKAEALDIITSVDEAHLSVNYLSLGNTVHYATLYIVLGNGNWEMVADHTIPKDPVMAHLLYEVLDEFATQWEPK